MSDCIWVNLYDPINGPSFFPSPFKPVPLFMRQPSVRPVSVRHQPSIQDETLQRTVTLKTSMSGQSTVCPSQSTTPPILASGSSTQANHGNSRQHNCSGDYVPLGPVRQKTTAAYVKEEPLKLPSSSLVPAYRRSESRSSMYQTPPEYPEPLRVQFDVRNRSGPGSSCAARSPSPYPTAHARLASRSPPVTPMKPPHSSEYLERYKPVMSPGYTRQDPMEQSAQRQTLAGDRTRKLAERVAQGEERLSEAQELETKSNAKMKGVGAELKRFFRRR